MGGAVAGAFNRRGTTERGRPRIHKFLIESFGRMRMRAVTSVSLSSPSRSSRADRSKRNDAEIREFTAASMRALGGRVDILVTNAGVYPVLPTSMLSDEDLDAVLATNIRAPHALVTELAPGLTERGSGAVANIDSWMSRGGIPASIAS